MSQIALSAGMRNNLLSLQNTQSMLSKTQERLATGRKINSALDGPSNFFTAQGLNQRSNQLTSLLDSMNNSVQTIRAADQGFKSVTKLLENLMSTARQARQDVSANEPGGSLSFGVAGVNTTSNNRIKIGDTFVDLTASARTFTGSAADTNPGDFAVDGLLGSNAGTIVISSSQLGQGVYIELDEADDNVAVKEKINEALANVPGGTNIDVSVDNGQLVVRDFNGSASDLKIRNANGSSALTVEEIFGSVVDFTQPGTTNDGAEVLTNQLIVDRINSTAELADTVRASLENNGNNITLQNLTLDDLVIEGANTSSITGNTDTDSATLLPGSFGSSERRAAMQEEFNTMIEQLDQTVRDAGFNGINLLNGESLRVVFNELTGADQSALNVRLNNADGSAFGRVTAANLGIETGANFQSNAALDSLIDSITNATDRVRNLNSQMSANLSVVENRQDFTKGMISILDTGADNLTLADMNEEAANSLALQTRSQLGQTALSLTAQQDQSVLALLR